MKTISAQEIKRRGISAIDSLSDQGPVYVIRNNRPDYVVMTVDDYNNFMNELTEARVAASEEDLAAGRVERGTAAELMQSISGE